MNNLEKGWKEYTYDRAADEYIVAYDKSAANETWMERFDTTIKEFSGQFLLNYDNMFGKHHVTGVGGFEFTKRDYHSLNVQQHPVENEFIDLISTNDNNLVSENKAITSTASWVFRAYQYGLLSEGRKVYEYKTADRIYKIMNVNLSVLQLSNHKLLLNRLIECCRELEQEQVGAAVLGCTGMCSMIESLKAALHENGIHIQVIEPLKAGVTSLEYMVRMGYSNRIYGATIGAFPD